MKSSKTFETRDVFAFEAILNFPGRKKKTCYFFKFCEANIILEGKLCVEHPVSPLTFPREKVWGWGEVGQFSTD